MRFIPTAVLVGFINAVAINIILGQFDALTGYEARGANRIMKALDTLGNVLHFNYAALLVGILTIVLVLLLERTRLGALSMVVAVVVGSALASILTLPFIGAQVSLLSSVATVPNALPGLMLPDFSMIGALIIPALSLALVGLVQGAAISGSIPNPDGRYPDPSADFRGQGIANLATSIFQGMPVGGSMSSTSLVRAAGAKTALANLFAGVVMAACILALGPIIGLVAMPSLAGLLILVGFRTLKIHDLLMVWKTGPIQATVLSVTFVLTLLIPLQYAVLTGVGLAVVLHVARMSNRIVVRRWVFEKGRALPSEVDPPQVLGAGETVVLVPYGSLFFAAAPIFEKQLPLVTAESRGTVVVIRLRGKDELGSTFLKTLDQYSRSLQAAGSVLLLAGLSTKVHEQLVSTGTLSTIGASNVFVATEHVGDSLQAALDEAENWRARQ